ncbi:LAFA_0E05490g1_1 [Lachancea sp. 'fantastica']|nr:LAFA_0E05490g1_1 [Lachancea sp. 'fantastica']
MHAKTGEVEAFRFKGKTQLGPHQRVLWNPQLALYLVVTGKTITVNRQIDDQRVATVVLKDVDQVFAYQWDQETGKRFAVFYRNGIVKIYDCTTAGGQLQKVVNITETQNKALSSAVWARVAWETFSDTYAVLNVDVAALMPDMVRIVRDSKQVSMAPMGPWGPDLSVPEASVILAHSQEDRCYLLTVDDLVTVRFSSEIDQMCKILPPRSKHGPFVGVARDGTLEHIRLQLTEVPLMRELVKNSGYVRFLCDYLADHISVCKSDLIDPFAQFLARLKSAYSGSNLYTQLCEVLVSGSVDPALEDWLCNSVGDKNYKRWKQLSTRMYGDLNNVLTLAVVPACERLILACERMQGIHKSLKLQKLKEIGEFDATKWPSPEVDVLLQECQKMLTDTLRLVADLNAEAALHTTFQEWFYDVVMECVDEDYKRKPSVENQNGNSAVQLERYLNVGWNSSTASSTAHGLDLLATRARDQLVTCANELDRLYTKPWILELVQVNCTGAAEPHMQVWDAIVDETDDDADCVFLASQKVMCAPDHESSSTSIVSITRCPGPSSTTANNITMEWDLNSDLKTSSSDSTDSKICDAIFITSHGEPDARAPALVVLHGSNDTSLTTLKLHRSSLVPTSFTLTGSTQQLQQGTNLFAAAPATKINACFPGTLLSVHNNSAMAVYEMSYDQHRCGGRAP